MLTRFGQVLVRRSGRALVIAALVVLVLAVAGARVKDRLSVGGFVDGSAESSRTTEELAARFDAGAPNYVVVAAAQVGVVDEPGNAAAGNAIVAHLAGVPGVGDVLSPWTLDLAPDTRNPLRSRDGTKAAIALRLDGDEDRQRRTAETLAAQLGERDGYRLTATGPAEVSRAAAHRAERDLTRAELFAALPTVLGLLLVFRGWRAAVIPLGVAVVAVVGTFAVLSAITLLTDVSIFALNLTTALGLGLGIDYSLLLVARFREERRHSWAVQQAVRRTMETAGRTVLWSGATVALSLLALLVFPFGYLRSFAYAGLAVVAMAALAAVSIVPALLSRYGHRMTVGIERVSGRSRWGLVAAHVTRHPWLYTAGTAALLIAGALPFRHMQPGRLDDRFLPKGDSARVAADQLRHDFYFVDFNPVTVLAPHVESADDDAVTAMEIALLGQPYVSRVDSVHGHVTAGAAIPPSGYSDRFRGDPGEGTWFAVTSYAAPDSDAARELVGKIRALDADITVTGTTASVLDTIDGVRQRVPYALAIVAVTTFLLLFAMTGSLLVPLKAVVLNLLSLTATFGMLVWVFQEGHLASWLGVTVTGQLDVFTPVLMFCIAFGLSMDYEVFLLARIKEEYDLSGDNTASIVRGVERTGPLVTAAAVLVAIVFIAIATSGLTIVKMFGVGLALAVLVDAFVVRSTLVPAFMRIAGNANWWAPRPVRRFHLRWGIWEQRAPRHHRARPERRTVNNNTDLARRLADVPLFARCTQRDLRTLARHAQPVDVRADQVIVRQGDRADAFYLLLDGTAIVARDGTETTQLQPGDFFGELALLDPAPRAASVIALTDARLAVLGERIFKVVLRDLPHLSAAMLGTLAGRLRTAGAPHAAD